MQRRPAIAMSPKASTRLLATQSDERLVALARAGHDRAFEALVLRHRAALLRYCKRLSLSEGRAEDAVQQSLLQAWTALRRGVEVRDVRAWLYRIVHNTAINVVRDAARDGQFAAEPETVDSAASARAGASEPDLECGLAAREALGGIAALPQMQREVIFRTAVAGHSHEEVASALGLSDGAVRGLLYRARATLRASITAITPPPLLTWMVGVGQGSGVERVSELTASGGGLGVGSLLVKGIAALTAGTLLTGAVIVHTNSPVHHHASKHGASAAGGEVASLGGSNADGSGSLSNAHSGHQLGPSSSSSGSHSHVGGARPHHRAPLGRANARAHTHGVPGGSSPLSTGGGSSGANSTSPNSAATHPPGSSQGTSTDPSQGTAPGGSSTGGSVGAGGNTQGGSGTTGGSGGSSGAGSTGAGGAGSGGSTGEDPGGSSQPAQPPAGSGSGGASEGGGAGGGSTGGSSGGGSTGGGAGSGGGSSSSEGPVGTVVHEVTGLLESTVNGVLGSAKPSS